MFNCIHLATVALIALGALESTTAQCTLSYAQLEQLSANFVLSRGEGTISTLSSATYRENFKPSTLQSSAVFNQPLIIDSNRSIHDSVQCSTYTELIITDSTHPYVIGTQIHYTPTGDAAHVDTLITDAGDWLFNATGTLYYASKEDWSPIPLEKRDTRAAIQAGADAYLDLFKDKATMVPWGTPCNRLEGGLYTGNGSATDSCNMGVPNRVVEMTQRKYVIDEVLGTVDVFVSFGGDCGTGRPDSHEFRMENGKLRYIHTITVMDPSCPGLPSEACLCVT